ncbi:hypothetical protein NIES4073_43790 [Kalymmatonema gypsitolerans NIES-4073]|nr:hypothetical protein NIES4073_43790 [Scytonema sp. NIES-4073]
MTRVWECVSAAFFFHAWYKFAMATQAESLPPFLAMYIQVNKTMTDVNRAGWNRTKQTLEFVMYIQFCTSALV